MQNNSLLFFFFFGGGGGGGGGFMKEQNIYTFTKEPRRDISFPTLIRKEIETKRIRKEITTINVLFLNNYYVIYST